jgi:integrase
MKLFKRDPDNPEAPYYWRGMVRGTRHLWSTKTNDKATALKRAKHHRDALIAEKYHLVDAQKARSGIPTVGMVIGQYKDMAAALQLPEATVKKNIKSLRLVLEASGLGDNDTLDKLGRAVAVKWQSKMTAASMPATTINSRQRCAYSLFSARCMMRYDPPLPTAYLDDFRSVPLMQVDEQIRPMPDAAAIAKAHELLPANPQHYRAFLLGAYGGLRSSEIVAARWDWIEGDTIIIGGREYVAKSGKWRAVKLAADVLAKLGTGEPTASIIGEAAATVVRRQLPVMLKALGFAGPDPVHSLRRWFGSMVATRHGIFAARDALGHSTTAVTERHYARLLTAAAPIAIDAPAPGPNPPQPPQTGAACGPRE